jgi:hypothetical protein
MKLNRQKLRRLILEALKKEKKEITDSQVRAAVKQCLKKEGGAAGMDLLIDCVEALEKKKGPVLPSSLNSRAKIKKCILSMEFIVKHKHGDIIDIDGCPAAHGHKAKKKRNKK